MFMSEKCNELECGSQAKCEGCPSNQKGGFLKETHPKNRIRHVVGIVSGKGGVGKSSVTSLLALEMHRRGYSVGILDADITGPSIPKAFGVTGNAYGVEDGIIPPTSPDGIKIMSINLLLDDPEKPVIWRGPILANMVTQFCTDVIWGDLDYLFVDMPPGTGDVPLTVFQSLPLSGVIIVSASQDLVNLIVKKAIHMAQDMNIPIYGLIENMSYFICPNCHEKHYIFGKSHLDEVSEEMHLPILARMPIDPQIAASIDAGEIEKLENNPLHEAAEILITQ